MAERDHVAHRLGRRKRSAYRIAERKNSSFGDAGPAAVPVSTHPQHLIQPELPAARRLPSSSQAPHCRVVIGGLLELRIGWSRRRERPCHCRSRAESALARIRGVSGSAASVSVPGPLRRPEIEASRLYQSDESALNPRAESRR